VTFQLSENTRYALADGYIIQCSTLMRFGSLSILYIFIEYITFLFVHKFILALVYIFCIFFVCDDLWNSHIISMNVMLVVK
jgi:hypothetical protein